MYGDKSATVPRPDTIELEEVIETLVSQCDV